MLTFVLAFLLATPLPPRPAQYVTDSAGVLDAARARALNEKLAEFERRTSDQVLVYIAPELPAGTTLEEMGAEAIKTWGVGQKGKDNGAILFLFINDRKMRIEVGYGLEGALTDAKSKDILSTVLKPHLKDGDYTGAVEDGTNAILATIAGEPYAGTGRTVAQSAHSGRFSGLSAFFSRFFFVLVLLPVLIAINVYRRGRRGSSFGSSSDSGWSGDSSSFDSSSSSSSSSSSDFSGGGGSGGGGGASDSW